jgi:ParB family transcriptional regulator, chromosome partitioning protein
MNQATKASPLGRGLSALFGDADASYQAKPIATTAPAKTEKSAGPLHVALTWLQPGALQPRRHFDQEALKGLADSIREHGILEPLVVRKMRVEGGLEYAKDIYEIVAGERRWRAAQLAGLHDVPVIVRELTDRDAAAFAIIENVQREGLTPLEEAEGYRRLLGLNYTQEELAKSVGKSRPHIANMIRILTLPDAVKQMIEKGTLTLGHARAIITAKDPLALAQEIVRKGLNVRQAEALAKQSNENPQIHKRKFIGQSADILALEKDLERATGMKVKIQTQGKSGSLSVYYHDLEQLDAVAKKLKG